MTYGAEFRRNLAVVAWQAGLTARPDETLETHLNTRLDLIEAVEEAMRRPQFSGRRREGSTEFASWLHDFAALRAGKVTPRAT